MNTLMRQGMALMQSLDFKVDIETVKYVYESTTPTCSLRKFIIAIFCQRTEPLKHFFRPEFENLGILRDAAAFLKVLEKARHKFPSGGDAGALESGWSGRYRWRSDEQGNPTFAYGGDALSAVDWSKVEYGLPAYLIWDEHGGVFPDEFFVTPEEAWQAAQEAWVQMAFAPTGELWSGMGTPGFC
jgi:hypothetical protein